MPKLVYKILAEAAHEAAKGEGRFLGTSDDLRDGYIHLSAGHQVAGTLAKHFPGQEDLLLLTLDTDKLGPALKWEPSRGGEDFPHLYGPLDLAAIVKVDALQLDDDNRHILPEGVAG
jgi:uncharacterized protein (DUF952 family)